MIEKRHIILLLLLLAGRLSPAQSLFSRWDSIPVTQAGDTLDYPFAGGFNNPQFSDIDLNGDGIQDLFVFDRGNNRVYTFINGGKPNQVDYTYAPEYRSRFPEMTDWALLEDFNCDGKEDLFTGRGNSFAVYRNDFNSNDGLHFTYLKTFADTQLYIASTDIPALSDVDGDGQLDVLTFEPGGSTMYYFKNIAMETYGTCDSLKYTLSETCWGQFMEAFGNCSVTLGILCKGGGDKEALSGGIHAGSTTLALDLDGDGDMELLIGDITCNSVKMLYNGGTPAAANIVSSDSLYPSSTHIDVYRFPATFYEDVNNDGLKDLLVAPNGKNVSENFMSVWLYKNTGTPPVPDFALQTKDFLQHEMIDVGEGSNPTFLDYNADSLLDIVVGDYGYFTPNGNYASKLALYENTGTKTHPSFKLITRDYANIASYNLNGIYPAFGDMDGDGDMDMIIGDYSGNLHYFTNSAGTGNPPAFSLAQPLYKGIDVGQFATPQIVDVNRDGKPDLLVGERGGTLNYFENIGTETNPDFSSTPTDDFFGGIDVQIACCTGYSSPLLTVLDTSDNYTLLVGTEKGFIREYSNIENNLSGNFTLLDSIYENINEGERSSISGGDLNGDGAVDLVIGNYAGGILLLQNHGDSVPPVEPIDTLSFAISVYPNPSSDFLNVRITGLSAKDMAEITIHNLLGQLVYSSDMQAVFNHWIIPLDIREYSKGVYLLNVDVSTRPDEPNHSLLTKFVVLN